MRTMRNDSQRPHRRRTRDAGWILITQVLMLGAMTTMAAFAVDVGSFFNRATDLQKAADAAALAAVVWMPDQVATATTVAREAARRNGFTHGVNGITVDVSTVPGNPRQLHVNITDAQVPTYFGKLVRNSITMQRDATAEYVLAVPLGSPSNTFGNQALNQTTPNFWGAINGPYTSTANGDPFATRCRTRATQTSCQTLNPEYRNTGYLYAVDVPQSAVGSYLIVQVFDAGYYNRSNNRETGDSRMSGNAGSPIEFELFESDSTPLDNTDNPSLDGRCLNSPGRLAIAAETNAATYKNKWATLCTVQVNRSGVFPLRVKSGNIASMPEIGDNSNQYSLRAITYGVGAQPRLYGLGDMSLFMNATGASTFHLAEVSPIHAGKTFQIDLFDPGDGGNGNYYLEILGPDATVATCRYTSPTGAWGNSGPCRIQTRSTTAGNRYNDKWVNIRVELGAAYSCTTNCWWQVRYDFGTAVPTDRTTWRAQILGDPVHLVK